MNRYSVGWDGDTASMWDDDEGEYVKYAEIAALRERCEKYRQASIRAKMIIESEDTHYVGEATREAAIEVLALLNAVLRAEGEGGGGCHES